MKKTYMTPSMTAVKLLHQSIICESVHGINSNDVYYGGASSGNTGGSIRAKESSGVWDEEW